MARRQHALAAIEAAVRDGARCPLNDQIGGSKVIAGLALEGLLKIEVYAHNYRVVTMLTGELKGRHTPLPPGKSPKPYLVIDASGTRRPGRPWSSPSTSRAGVTLPKRSRLG
jgi:hypothetical protein